MPDPNNCNRSHLRFFAVTLLGLDHPDLPRYKSEYVREFGYAALEKPYELHYMPIFEKSGKRIYFAHIPKSGGVSVYSAFLSAGWKIKNVSVSHNPQSSFSILRHRFGIENIEQEGRLFRYPHPAQHAPFPVWRTWGPFETSFAITREPGDRLLSALKFYHRRTNDQRSFGEFAVDIHRQVKEKYWAYLFLLHGHLIPQYYFLGRKTELFRFEDDWGKQIASRFDVALPPQDNRSPLSQDKLPHCWRVSLKNFYKRDYAKFNY